MAAEVVTKSLQLTKIKNLFLNINLRKVYINVFLSFPLKLSNVIIENIVKLVFIDEVYLYIIMWYLILIKYNIFQYLGNDKYRLLLKLRDDLSGLN